MIDKKIFYCWFGPKQKSLFEDRCIESWHVQCPDYSIVEINESNFDVNLNDFCKQAYEHGNYSFVSDIARMEILKQHSGFYLDTDIMLLKSLDSLRKYDAIVPLNGKGFYNSAPLGCDTFVPLYSTVYDRLQLGRCINTLMNECCYELYDVLGMPLEVHDNIAFLGNDYFVTPGYSATSNTIGIHYCLGSWLDKWQGGYDKSKTFKAFEVYQNGIRDLGTEVKYYGDNIRIGTLHTYYTPMTKDLIFYGNYFYNRRVVRVYNDKFSFTRFGDFGNVDTVKVEDVFIECVH